MTDDGGRGRGEGYYDDLSSKSDAARASGWRRSIGQRARFEMALAPWRFDGVESLLDLGCGDGALYAYLEETGRAVEYTGIDLREGAIDAARERHPRARFRCGDFLEFEPSDSFDLVVSIGGHIDGRPPEGARDRRRRIRGLMRKAARIGRVGFSCVVLDEGAVRERASLRLEAALYGAYRAECDRWVDDLATRGRIVDDALATDLAVLGAPAGSSAGPRAVEGLEILESVADGHRGQEEDCLDVAWLWLEARRLDRAEAILESAETEGVRYRHLLERLRAQRASET